MSRAKASATRASTPIDTTRAALCIASLLLALGCGDDDSGAGGPTGGYASTATMGGSGGAAVDAGPPCGDGICSTGELCRHCPVDCGECLSEPLRLEAEELELETFAAEELAIASGGAVARLPAGSSGVGRASVELPADRYRVSVAYFDENDGKATAELLLDEQSWEAWSFDEETDVSSAVDHGFVIRPLVTPLVTGVGQTVAVALAAQAEGGERASIDYLEIAPLPWLDPSEAPESTWVLRFLQAPTKVWESGVAYDPVRNVIVQHGGHVLKSYPQSAYTHIYDVASNTFRESAAPDRPQRRCIVELAYVDSLDRMITGHGSSNHGSWSEGRLQGDGTSVDYGDPRGPWMYDVGADRWEDRRTLRPEWLRTPHAQLAYDSSSDALVTISGDTLSLYSPSSNRIVSRALPPELVDRKSYAIAADPVERKIVVFGGTGPSGWTWVGQDQAAYDAFVHDDTWLYDIVANSWEQVDTPTRPPKGMPLENHIRISMTYHAPSGLMLLLQVPLDTALLERMQWPPPELWAFDVAARAWQRIEMHDPPPFPGLVHYAEAADLLILFGGGRDAARPSQSHHVYAARVVPSSAPPREPPSPSRIELEVRPADIRLSWPTAPGERYRVWRAELATFPGAYELVSEAFTESGELVDATLASGQDYAYVVEREGAVRRSLPAFSRPLAPSSVRVEVASASEATLSWTASESTGVVGYHVYREAGPLAGSEERLTPDPVAGPPWFDTAAGLADGLVRSYHVRAVDVRGRESGASPLAYTVPEAPLAFAASVEGPTTTRLSWQLPADPNLVGVNVYFTDYHLNTHEKPVDVVTAWRESWILASGTPATGGELTFVTPPASADAPHLYFLARAVNVLGQEGFWTDILSATDDRFRAALGP